MKIKDLGPVIVSEEFLKFVRETMREYTRMYKLTGPVTGEYETVEAVCEALRDYYSETGGRKGHIRVLSTEPATAEAQAQMAQAISDGMELWIAAVLEVSAKGGS